MNFYVKTYRAKLQSAHTKNNQDSSTALKSDQNCSSVSLEDKKQEENNTECSELSTITNESRLAHSLLLNSELVIDDIEDLASTVPPLERFGKRGKLNVTDFSAQVWCEKQLEFVLITGKKRETNAMRNGTLRHNILEAEDHEVIEVEVTTKEEILGLTLLNTINQLDQLSTIGKVREVWAFGVIEGVVIRGIIDELSFTLEEGIQKVLIADTKTRSVPMEPSNAQKRTTGIQLQLYRWMLDELRNGKADFETLFTAYDCNPLRTFNIEQLEQYNNLMDLSKHLAKQFTEMAPLSNQMKVTYECNGTEFSNCWVPYTLNETLYGATSLLEWWHGYRNPDAVLLSEKWKCKNCDFLADCFVTPLCEDDRNAILLKRQNPESETPVLPSTLTNVDTTDIKCIDSGCTSDVTELSKDVIQILPKTDFASSKDINTNLSAPPVVIDADLKDVNLRINNKMVLSNQDDNLEVALSPQRYMKSILNTTQSYSNFQNKIKQTTKSRKPKVLQQSPTREKRPLSFIPRHSSYTMVPPFQTSASLPSLSSKTTNKQTEIISKRNSVEFSRCEIRTSDASNTAQRYKVSRPSLHQKKIVPSKPENIKRSECAWTLLESMTLINKTSESEIMPRAQLETVMSIPCNRYKESLNDRTHNIPKNKRLKTK